MVFRTMLDSKSRDCKHCSLCKMSCSTSMIPVWKEDEARVSGVYAGTEQQHVKGCETQRLGTVQYASSAAVRKAAVRELPAA